MPRVHKKTKNRGGKTGEYRCVRCPDPIVSGETYFEWSFRYGGTHRQHTKHGSPRQSQLTQSKMSGVYAEVEAVEDLLGEDTYELDDLTGAIDNLASTVDEVAEEYRDAAEHFGGEGEQAERASELDDFSSTLGQFSPDEFDAEGEESLEDWRERIKAEAEEALGECP